MKQTKKFRIGLSVAVGTLPTDKSELFENIIDRIIKGDLHITEETIVNREIISVRTTKEKYNELVKIAGEHGITIQGLLRMGIEQFNLGTSSQK